MDFQIQDADTIRGGRPAEPVVTDASCYTLVARTAEVAVARGGAALLPVYSEKQRN